MFPNNISYFYYYQNCQTKPLDTFYFNKIDVSSSNSRVSTTFDTEILTKSGTKVTSELDIQVLHEFCTNLKTNC